MNILFTPHNIGNLRLPNRLVRSATAERMTDLQDGRPQPRLAELYRQLARGGVGLIITGHMFVHPSGKAHSGMTGVYSDELIPALASLAEAVHQEEGLIAAQINHGGMLCHPDCVKDALAPSDIEAFFLPQAARQMSEDEIWEAIDAFGQAARRVKEAGFDAVQVHSAHGYLNSQFLSPWSNRREDPWGGDISQRMHFLREVCNEVRKQVGVTYPVFIKLGMLDGMEGGLAVEESLQVVTELESMRLDALEISGGISEKTNINIRKGIHREEDEGYFLPIIRQARLRTRLPILAVGGFRSLNVMEKVLQSGDADFISLCRPLICEPDFPNQLRSGRQIKSRCISANNCWESTPGEGISCKCPLE
ncbi:MAG: NADH:flavin oxidoreductase [Anaerolineales bacterium]|nr:NADH:flavin oxidoreductase [Anaerolineales bacterium]